MRNPAKLLNRPYTIPAEYQHFLTNEPGTDQAAPAKTRAKRNKSS